MKTLTNRIMKNIFAIITVLCLIGLQSCDWGGTGMSYPYPDATAEINTPTGCLKSKGRYYDPKLKTCVQVTDQHQALVLNAYRYVNQLAEKNAGETEYAIYPKKVLTVTEADTLWSDLHKNGGKMLVLGGTMPDGRVYDLIQEWTHEAYLEELKWQKEYNEKPRVWSGPVGGESCGWMKDYDAPADTIQGMLVEGIKNTEKERPRPELRKAITENGDCRISYMSVHSDAKVMLNWVNRHLNDLEGVQPIVDYLDKNMPELGPTQALKEGN